MPTEAKREEVSYLKDRFEQATSFVLADYHGLTASQMVKLREKFTKQGLEFRVVKDTLARIAAKEAGLPELIDMLIGPIGIAIGYDDPALAFKLSEECRKLYTPHYIPKGGVFEGVVILEGEVRRYASMLSREELLAKLAMLCASPMRVLAVVLKDTIRELATVLSSVCSKLEEEQNKEEQDG